MVCDSTTLVRAFLRTGGVTGKLLERAVHGKCEQYLADALSEGTQQVLLHRAHVRRHFACTNLEVDEYVVLLRSFARVVATLPAFTVCRDPHEDDILATALAAEATYLVARDTDRLTLATYQDLTIVSPEAFLQLLRTEFPAT